MEQEKSFPSQQALKYIYTLAFYLANIVHVKHLISHVVYEKKGIVINILPLKRYLDEKKKDIFID